MCNDEANYAECIYDGGDCCGACINTDICSECTCQEEIDPTTDLTCMCNKSYFHKFSLHINKKINLQGGPHVLEQFPEAVAPLIFIFQKIYLIFIR